MLRIIFILLAIIFLGLYSLGVSTLPRVNLNTLGLGLLFWLFATVDIPL